MNTLRFFAFFCIALCFTTVDANSQTDLSLEQLKEYNKGKLSLDLVGVSSGSYSSNMISYSSWTKWNAYKGFNSISESEFYKIAGYEDFALKAQKREETGKILFWSGLGLGIGGLALIVATIDNESDVPALIGATISLLGSGLMYVSIGMTTTNMKPYTIASDIADEYNLQLTIKIKKSF